MSYLILFLTSSLTLATALHLRHQYRQTAHIRQRLQNARSDKTLRGMHSLRVEK